MAVVTKTLVQLIAKQVDEKGLIVWYDPEQAYVIVAAELSLPNTTVPGTTAASSDCETRSITCSTIANRLGLSSTCRLNAPKPTAP